MVSDFFLQANNNTNESSNKLNLFMFQIYQYYTINNHDSHHKWKLEAGGWRLEVRGWRLEVGD